jgi:two-component system nitrogen regulation response regulator GlnG
MDGKRHLLVIDDDPLTLDCFCMLFPKGQVTVQTATSASEGLNLFPAQPPDAVVLDVRLPDLSGLNAFQLFRELDPKIPIILITGQGTAGTAIEAMRLGAYEFVLKPIDPAALRDIIVRAFEISRLMRVPAKITEPGPQDEESDILIGKCPAMQEVYKAIGRVAPQDMTALILGESGTGKELVARAIYHYSNRANGPFLAINCAAIPETLLETELFGHEKGSFTGADRRRIGRFEQCNGGTLFLDEIGDMTPLTQTKILRVLQEKKFERVGGTELIQTDVRIIAATNHDLESRVAKGTFRGDLYYRLNVVTLKLPPLRERGEDFPLLAEHFLKKFSRELGKEIHAVAPEALDILRRYAWPGNVRELQSVMKQAILQATGPILASVFLPASIAGDASFSQPENTVGEMVSADLTRLIENRLQAGSTDLYAEFHAITERLLLLRVLQYTENNLTQAARILGISRVTLRSKLGLLGVTIERSTTMDENHSH